MSKENNIDKLFRNSLKDQEFAFNESAWGEMESMLDARSSKIAWYRTSRFAAALLLLISVGSGFWYSQMPNSSEQQLANIPSELELNNVQEEIQNTVEPNSSVPVLADASLVSTPVVNQKLNNNTRKVNNPSISNDTEQQNRIEIAGIFNSKNIQGFSTSKPTSFRAQAPAATQQIDIRLNEEDYIADSEVNSSNTEYNNYDSEEEYLDFPASAPMDPVDKSQIVNKRHSLDVALANTFNHGFSNNSGIFGNNILNSIGVEYAYQLNDKLIIGSGLFYKSKTGNGLNLGYSQEQYGFGKTTTNTLIQVNSLHYAEVPLFVDLQLFRKHHFIGGASVSYLTGVRNRIAETKTETIQGTQTNFETQWGLEDKFNSIDVGLRIGYEYELTKNIKVGANAQFGLIDFTNDSQWSSLEKNRHKELQISLKYKFLRF